MKILHILYSGLGGHGNVFFSMVKADINKEFEYTVLFNGIENVRNEYIEKCEQLNIKWSYVKKKRGLDFGFYRKIMSSIRKIDADIIFLHGSTQILWTKVATVFQGKKRKIFVRETQANHLKHKQDWVWLIGAMLLANKIIFLTQEYRQEIRNKLSVFYISKKILVIPNGIDLNDYKASKNTHKDGLLFGMQSRIVDIKDHQTMILGFSKLLSDKTVNNNIMKLLIAGEGDSKLVLEKIVKELSITNNVEFTGILSEQEIIVFLDKIDIYVHASFGETMSTAIMQAMAFSKPIIASDVSGINNMIENGVTGVLIPVLDEQAMFMAMKDLSENTGKAARLSVGARKYAELNFSSDVMFRAYRDAFLANK